MSHSQWRKQILTSCVSCNIQHLGVDVLMEWGRLTPGCFCMIIHTLWSSAWPCVLTANAGWKGSGWSLNPEKDSFGHSLRALNCLERALQVLKATIVLWSNFYPVTCVFLRHTNKNVICWHGNMSSQILRFLRTVHGRRKETNTHTSNIY